MFGSTNKNAANIYANIGLETGVIAASPHKLISMLFDGAMVAISMAEKHMQEGNMVAKGADITKAMGIISEGLRASLRFDVGGDISQNLDALYDYMYRRLFSAHAKNDVEILKEVHELLAGLKSAWDEIEPQARGQAISHISQQLKA